MTAKGVRKGDRVKVETKAYEGIVKSYDHIVHEMHVLTDVGTNHYFDPTLTEVTVTVIPPAFKTGQVWETPDGTHWFIRRANAREFCAIPIGHGIPCTIQTRFLEKLPKLIFPVGA